MNENSSLYIVWWEIGQHTILDREKVYREAKRLFPSYNVFNGLQEIAFSDIVVRVLTGVRTEGQSIKTFKKHKDYIAGTLFQETADAKALWCDRTELQTITVTSTDPPILRLKTAYKQAVFEEVFNLAITTFDKRATTNWMKRFVSGKLHGVKLRSWGSIWIVPKEFEEAIDRLQEMLDISTVVGSVKFVFVPVVNSGQINEIATEKVQQRLYNSLVKQPWWFNLDEPENITPKAVKARIRMIRRALNFLSSYESVVDNEVFMDMRKTGLALIAFCKKMLAVQSQMEIVQKTEFEQERARAERRKKEIMRNRERQSLPILDRMED